MQCFHLRGPLGHFRRGTFSSFTLLLLAGCDGDTSIVQPSGPIDAGVPDLLRPDAGAPPPAGQRPDASADAGTPITGAPTPDTSPSTLDVDVFGQIGNRYWLEASAEQVDRMNARYLFAAYPDPYEPIAGGDVTFVDHLFVTAASEAPHSADFGKVQVSLVGESTGRAWTRRSLPNFKLDADEFTPGQRIGGVKHLRFNNGVMGGMFREKLIYDTFNRLGYPAPRVNHAWVSGSVWGPGVAVPYIVVESYKPQFCKLHENALAGGCVNMWELASDINGGAITKDDSCQFSSCDNTRVVEFAAAVASATYGNGYEAQLEAWIDWPALHRFQCLAWIFELQDDLFHSINNVVLVERADGKFQYLPYSVDVSLDTQRFGQVDLGGVNTVSNGCQTDAQCWADTVSTCETVLAEVIALDLPSELQSLHAELDAGGMLRESDEESFNALDEHLQTRLTLLPAELERNRHAPIMSWCYDPLSFCGPYCTLPEACNLCEPPVVTDAGVELPPPVDCLPLPSGG